MEKVKYNVCDDEGTLIDTVWEAPEHVGGKEDAVDTVSKKHEIEKQYLHARPVKEFVSDFNFEKK